MAPQTSDKKYWNPWKMVFWTRQMFRTCIIWRYRWCVWMVWEGGLRWRSRNDRQNRIQKTRGGQIEELPKAYWQYKELFKNEKAEMLGPRRTFDHAINVKDGATPPCGPIYPMSGYQLEEQNKYLHKMLPEGKIVHSKSPAEAPILFVRTPDGRLRLYVDVMGVLIF